MASLPTQRILYIPFDQLHRNYGVLKSADKATNIIAMIESQEMIEGANWHPERLFFLISSARHFAKDLQDEGFTVDYRKAANTPTGLQKIQKEHPKAQIICAEQSSFRLTEKLATLNPKIIPNDFFLTPRDLFASWAGSQKSYLMENFYRKQRVRLGVLMEGDQPAGGAWNFDKDNRLPPPLMARLLPAHSR
jgi:deoxyribodipyrimidine photolyase-related protein